MPRALAAVKKNTRNAAVNSPGRDFIFYGGPFLETRVNWLSINILSKYSTPIFEQLAA